GNAFAQEAITNGAAYAVIDDVQYKASDKFILVDDVLQTLQQLATYHRLNSKAKIIALTGSNGKTTTKELIAGVLSQKHQIIATKGNLNNHIGVPLTLLTIKENTEIAIVEMGANHQKEISILCQLAQPDYGYITNFGKAHLEGFGGIEGVIKGKSELYEYLVANGKHIFLNGDDPIQSEKLQYYIKKIGFSQNEGSYYHIKFKGAAPFVHIQVEDLYINTQLIGAYNFSNCAAAILMGTYFNVELPDIKIALEEFVPENNRSQILEKNGYTIVLDAYNANPTSMKAALEAFNRMPGQRKTVLLADMYELGESARVEHQNLAELVEKMHFDTCFLIGENFHKTHTTCATFSSFEALADRLKKSPLEKGTLLIKGSRGMAMERILDLL
ncbi:MAG: UDP-N-acetylmuramoyl-tripeptide--D-alanyl-D-alanine ligase, partial [Eudoraea sp.]|nr:UDP-N-acetylmuramoyl-tripeptide--D-alanyl-D-alanine ligase [Eudoraea sp.]